MKQMLNANQMTRMQDEATVQWHREGVDKTRFPA
jgi:hypothetical protein